MRLSAETCIKTSPVKSAENDGWFFYSAVTGTASLTSNQKQQEPPTWGPSPLNVESGPTFSRFYLQKFSAAESAWAYCHVALPYLKMPQLLFNSVLQKSYFFLFLTFVFSTLLFFLSLPATQSAATSVFVSFKKNPFSYCQRSHCSQFFFYCHRKKQYDPGENTQAREHFSEVK